MSAILQKIDIEVNTDLDRVVLSIGRTSYPMPYAEGFKIAANLSLAARHAMKVSGEPVSVFEYHPSAEEINPTRRTTMTSKFNWSIDVDSEMVLLSLAEDTIKIHCSDAARIAGWLKHGAKKAKRWAGDSSRSMLAVGRLSDAEENYKRGYH